MEGKMEGLSDLVRSPVGWILLIGVVALMVSPGFLGPEPERRVMAVLVSLVILVAGLFVVLSGSYKQDTEKWAFGAIGLVIGYWLPANT
jgi:hypothetical protein